MQQRIAKFNRILKIREDSRKNEQAILAAERSEELEVMNHLTKLESEKNQAIKDFSSVGDKMISANDLWFQRQFIDAIDSDINKGKNALIDVRNRIIGTEARLVERHKDVKIMETYIELDDVATMQFSRKGVF